MEAKSTCELIPKVYQDNERRGNLYSGDPTNVKLQIWLLDNWLIMYNCVLMLNFHMHERGLYDNHITIFVILISKTSIPL